MDQERKNYLVNRIISGYTFYVYNGITYKIYDYNSESEYLADVYLSDLKDDLYLNGYYNNNSLQQILISKNLWNDSLDKELKILKEDQEKILLEINRKGNIRATEQKYLIKMLETNKKRYSELYYKKESLSNNSMEYLYKLERLKIMVFLNTYDSNHKRVWNDINEFYNNTSDALIKRILIHTYLNHEISDTEIRYISRHDPWRLYWRTASKCGNLFNKPSTQMTEHQRNIVSWSILYDSVFESAEPPDMSIIENDVLFDAWITSQNKKDKQRSNDITDNEKIKNSQEISVMVYSSEDAEKVYSLNDSTSKSIISEREKAIKTKGQIDTTYLPDTQRELKRMVTAAGIENIKNKAR